MTRGGTDGGSAEVELTIVTMVFDAVDPISLQGVLARYGFSGL